jgi:hypothetical protein
MSKLDYLKRYMSKDETGDDKKKKKKSKKHKSSSAASGYKIFISANFFFCQITFFLVAQ